MVVLRCMLGAFGEYFFVPNELLGRVLYVGCGASWHLGVELRVGGFVFFVADKGAAAIQLGYSFMV